MSTPAVVPPLPSIPAEYAARKNQSRRSVSLGPSVWSSASRTQPTEAPISVKPPVVAPQSPRSTASPEAGAVSPPHQRSESRNSINFSYPMNSRTNSPTIPAGFDRNDAASGAAASLNKRPIPQTNKATRQQTQGAGPGSPGRSSRPVATALAAAQAAAVTRNDEPNTPPASSRPARHREKRGPEPSPSRSPVSVDVRSRPQAKKPPAPSAPSVLATHPTPSAPPVPADDRPIKELPQPAPVPANEQEKENQPLAKAVPLEEPPRALTPPVVGKMVRTPPVSPPQVKPTVASDSELQPPHLRQSSSPARTAHFPTQLAVSNLGADQLHQPPPRSLSPAKSAMKNRNNSLSPDGRLSGILRPGPTLSELSDATSVASDDGTRPNHRKKPVKVSFDDEAEVVGVAASPPTSPEDVLPESPPGKSKLKNSWFNIHKRKTSPLRSTDGDEFDEVLAPRAALPSFGSVRANKDSRRSESTAHREVNDNDSVLTESDDDFPNGHAINSIISRASDGNVEKQVQSNNALPAESTENAARGDAESRKETIPIGDTDFDPAYFPKTQLSPLREVPSDPNLPLTPKSEVEMPDITFQPATPDPERGRASLDEYDSPEEYPRKSVDEKPEVSSQKKEKRRSYGEKSVHQADNDNDSSSSVYSDAEEDLDDGDGFGSINAIVEHEAAPSEPGVAITSTSQDVTQEADRDPNTADIPETCRIAQFGTSAQESPQPAAGSPALMEPLPASSAISSSTLQREDKSTSAQGGVARSSTVPVEVYSIAHIRDDDPKEVDTRYYHAESDAPNAQRMQNYSHYHTEIPTQTQRKEVRSPDAIQLDVNGADSRMPRRQLSNGSDSSSSFKRARRATRGGVGMRQTLRGSQQSSSVPTSPTRVTAPRVESPPPLSGLGAGSTMRTTLRGNASRKEKPSFFSTGKAQKGKATKNSGAAFASRFPDSDSDSDGGIQNRRLKRPGHRPVRSMSDNDMRPVRGIPRRKGAHDGDSTELEDSSDGERRPASAGKTSARRPQPTTARDPALAAVAKSRGMTEEELEQMLNRGSSRKPNLLNRLSLRKSKPLTQRGKSQPSGLLPNGSIPEHSPMEAQSPQVTNGTHKSVGSPSRLLKKSQQKSPSGDTTTWPLGSENGGPVDSGIGSMSAPSTSQQPSQPQAPDGGAVNGSKAVSTDLHPSQGQEPPATGTNRASDVVIEGSGRKKRFSRLKKAFGIKG